MSTWWTGKGYGVSDITDISGRPLLTYQGPDDKKSFLISDRVAQTFDFTIPQVLTPGAMKNDRLDSQVSSFIKTKLGGSSDDELDHKISLELGGSNTPANLMVQPGRAAGASAASDQLENGLAVDVAAGRISLLSAWRTLADQKGFLLGEDSKIGTTFSFSQLQSTIFGIVQAVAGKQSVPPLTKEAIALRAQMQDDVKKMGGNPLDQKLQIKVFADNNQNLQNTLGVDINTAGSTNKSMLASYAQSKGIDPRELMGALNMNIQRILNNSSNDPNVFGIPSSVIIKVIGILQSVSTIAVTGGLILAIIGICIAGPEVILGALSGGLLESIGAIFGVSALTGVGLTAFSFGEAMTVASIGLGMTIKQNYDNTYLLPTQQITALKDALSVQKGLAAFLPSTQTSTPSGTTSGGQSVPAAKVKIFTGIVSQGTLSAVTDFTPRPSDFIQSVKELKTAAQNNLAPFLASLGSKIIYEVKIVSSITTADGLKQVGTTQKIVSSVSKLGVKHYKTIYNKFATLTLYILNDKGSKTKIKTIVLGPTNSATLQPTQSDLTALQGNLASDLHTSDINEITAVKTSTIIQTVTPPSTMPGTPAVIPPPDDPGNKFNTATGQSNPNYIPPAPAVVQKDAQGRTADQVALFNQLNPTRTITFVPVTTPVVTPAAPATPKVGSNASTLFEWYQAHGWTVPTTEIRAKLYEELGLGSATAYVASAEQNTKLLAALKAQ